MYPLTLGLGKPQRMVQIWEGWEYNRSCPNKKVHSQTEGLRYVAMWKQHQRRAWGHVLCCLHHLPAGAHLDAGPAAPQSTIPQGWALGWPRCCLLQEELDHTGSLSSAGGLQGVWSQKPLGFRPWPPRVSSGRRSLPLAFEASECIYCHLAERHCSKVSGLLHLLSSKFSSPRWKDPLLLLHWRRRENKCFQITHNLGDFSRRKNKHLERDRRITVTTYPYLGEDKPNALEAL